MFKQPTEFLGRNGQAKMAGILIDRLDGDLTLAPITSRQRIGRAYLLVPRESVPEVANAMLRVCGAAHRSRRKAVVTVRGGVAEVARCPAGMEVQIIDYDNREAEAADRQQVA